MGLKAVSLTLTGLMRGSFAGKCCTALGEGEGSSPLYT